MKNVVEKTVIINGEEMVLASDGQYCPVGQKRTLHKVFCIVLPVVLLLLSLATTCATIVHRASKQTFAEMVRATEDKSPIWAYLRGISSQPYRTKTEVAKNLGDSSPETLSGEERQTLTIRYVDIVGNTILPDTSLAYRAGDVFVVATPRIYGYDPVVETIAGIMADYDVMYVVYYLD